MAANTSELDIDQARHCQTEYHWRGAGLTVHLSHTGDLASDGLASTVVLRDLTGLEPIFIGVVYRLGHPAWDALTRINYRYEHRVNQANLRELVADVKHWRETGFVPPVPEGVPPSCTES